MTSYLECMQKLPEQPPRNHCEHLFNALANTRKVVMLIHIDIVGWMILTNTPEYLNTAKTNFTDIKGM